MFTLRVTSKNILQHEIIGLEVRILQYSDPKLVNLEGLVIDETLKTLLIELRNGKRIRVFKANGVFGFKIPDKNDMVVVKGLDIVGRPWERLKMI
ncbi:MAG: ribonuclease P protein subunit [Desulfurococcaceae archaeon]